MRCGRYKLTAGYGVSGSVAAQYPPSLLRTKMTKEKFDERIKFIEDTAGTVLRPAFKAA
ncbi:hypothetical protein HDU97_008790, partial [Phlyctochytrium planicorne]